MATAFITHPLYLEHLTGRPHPEKPQRLTAILDRLERGGVMSALQRLSPAPGPDLARWIGEVHSEAHSDALKRAVPADGLDFIDPDTVVSPKSLAAAELAVAGALAAVDGVAQGRFENAFCAVRPPGHHAESGRAMGFCLYNNVAAAARYAQKKHGLKKVFIADWDVHHGNGTQEIFYEDPSVFYFSTHQAHLYPGTGAEGERGRGPGDGSTLNRPLPPGAGDGEIIKAFEKDMARALEAFKPDIILLSAGFDAHRDDPLASLEVTEEGFGELTRLVRGLAREHCGGRVVSCLEGGYGLAALAASVERHLQELLGG